MRAIAALLCFTAFAAADEADDYFEVGLRYLRTGFYRDARAAFSESLVRAPNEAVPTAFTALACAAEGRDSRSCAYLIRLAYRRLPSKQRFQIQLDRVLATAANRIRIEKRFAKRLAESRGAGRIDNLTVLAFLQTHDGSPETSTAWTALKKERPNDAFVKALQKARTPKPKKPAKKPKADAPKKTGGAKSH